MRMRFIFEDRPDNAVNTLWLTNGIVLQLGLTDQLTSGMKNSPWCALE